MRIALVQHACSDDTGTSLGRVHDGIAEAAAGGADLILLQELHNGPYFCVREEVRAFDRAEPVPGPTTERLAAWAVEYDVVIVGSVFERRAAGIYHNTAIVLDRDGRFAGRYRKAHIPDDPGYSEKFYFTPGDTGFEPIDTAVGRLGVLVCWDQWFPEAARLMALAGADILLYPTAIGFDPADDEAEQARQLDAWITVQRGHAIANGLPLAACNRVGAEDGNRFWGNSFVCGPQGEMLARAGEDPMVLGADVDPARTEQIRRVWPFLRDRRIDHYGELLRRFRD
ncbi:MAG: carbon-nitrogen hydrolase [Halofilum sp. (in: g-proteobacteria)]